MCSSYLPEEHRVEIEGFGRQQRLAYTLRPAWAAVRIATEPAGALVHVDGDHAAALTAAARRTVRDACVRRLDALASDAVGDGTGGAQQRQLSLVDHELLGQHGQGRGRARGPQVVERANNNLEGAGASPQRPAGTWRLRSHHRRGAVEHQPIHGWASVT